MINKFKILLVFNFIINKISYFIRFVLYEYYLIIIVVLTQIILYHQSKYPVHCYKRMEGCVVM